MGAARSCLSSEHEPPCSTANGCPACILPPRFLNEVVMQGGRRGRAPLSGSRVGGQFVWQKWNVPRGAAFSRGIAYIFEISGRVNNKRGKWEIRQRNYIFFCNRRDPQNCLRRNSSFFEKKKKKKRNGKFKIHAEKDRENRSLFRVFFLFFLRFNIREN